jgi:hypothetical protein
VSSEAPLPRLAGIHHFDKGQDLLLLLPDHSGGLIEGFAELLLHLEQLCELRIGE